MRSILLAAFLWATAQDVPPVRAQSPSDSTLVQLQRRALALQRDLKDFNCLQLTTRSSDPTGTGLHWKRTDLLEVEDNYVGRFVNHKLVMRNKRPPGSEAYRDLSGFLSETVLHSVGFLPLWIFGPEARGPNGGVALLLGGSEKIDGADTREVEIHVPRASSGFFIQVNRESIVAGVDGTAYIEPVTGAIRRLKLTMDLPPDSPIQEGSIVIDYEDTVVSTTQLRLPVRSTVIAKVRGVLSKNDTQVLRYQKYSTETVIHFEDPIP